MLRVQHFRSKCIGCNACVEQYPERWRMSKRDGKCTLVGAKEKNGVYELKTGVVEEDYHRKAAESCPVKIIKVFNV